MFIKNNTCLSNDHIIWSYAYVYILICFLDKNAYYYYYYYNTRLSKIIKVVHWCTTNILSGKPFIAGEFMFWYHSTLIVYVSLTMSNAYKELLLSDNNLTSLESLDWSRNALRQHPHQALISILLNQNKI